MAKVRLDDNIKIELIRKDGQWESIKAIYKIQIDDQSNAPEIIHRHVTFPIADLPSQVKTDLQAAYQGILAHRDTLDIVV